MLTDVSDPNQNEHDFDFGFLDDEISAIQKPYLDNILQTLNEDKNISLSQNINEPSINVRRYSDQQNQQLQHVNLDIPSSSTATVIPQSNFFPSTKQESMLI